MAKPKARADRRPRGRFEPLEDRCLLSITPELIKDINTTEAGSVPHEFAVAQNVLFFAAATGDLGYELWKTDGTEAGTRLVKDIRSGTSGSAPTELTAVGDILYFCADDGVNGLELWRSDGTEAGTALVKDIVSGGASSSPRSLTAMGDALYFTAADGAGRELWRSDGTAAGTYRFADIRAGSESSNPNRLYNHNGLLVFMADDGEHGVEPWTSDGSSDGTQLLADILPGTWSSGQSTGSGQFASVGNALFFVADGGQGDQLWFYDGTKPPKLVSGSPPTMAVFQDSLYFVSRDASGRSTLFKTDGASASILAVGDFSSLGPSMISSLTAVAGGLVFTVQLEGACSVWSSDGASEGTVELRQLPASGVGYIAVGGLTLFQLLNAQQKWELLRSDGTTQGTEVVRVFAGPASWQFAQNDALFFSGDDGIHGSELWRSDGSSTGTVLVRNINHGTDGSQNRRPKFATGELVLFDALDENVGFYELWRTDGTEAGTVRIAGGVNGPWLGDDYTVLGDRVFFNAGTGFQGQLWTSDGTEAGTRLVKDLGQPNNGGSVRSLLVLGGSVYFAGDDGVHGRELWKSDGTEAGTALVADVRQGLQDSILGELSESRGLLFFAADDGASGFEPWVSDGTAQGTRRLGDLVPGRESSYPREFTTLGDRTLFWTDDGRGRHSLWATDGTPDGTTPILTADEASGPGSAQGTVVAGDFLFFTAFDAAGGRELWRSDGTAAGTQRVLDIKPGPSSALEYDWNYLIAVGRDLYFAADDGVHGRELWRSNGTKEGTSMVRDIGQNGRESSIGALVNVNGTVFFEADDGGEGRGLWRSDGTEAGTAPTGLASGGVLPVAIGRSLIATNLDGLVGNELFSLTPPPGDTNYDGLVDLTDFGRLKATFGATGNSLAADFDVNGVVDLGDFGLLKENFGRPGSASGDARAAKAVPTAAGRSAIAPLATTSEASPAGLPRNEWIEAVAYQLAWTLLAREQLPASIG